MSFPPLSRAHSIMTARKSLSLFKLHRHPCRLSTNDGFVYNAFTSLPGTLYAYAMSGCRASEKTKRGTTLRRRSFLVTSCGNRLRPEGLKVRKQCREFEMIIGSLIRREYNPAMDRTKEVLEANTNLYAATIVLEEDHGGVTEKPVHTAVYQMEALAWVWSEMKNYNKAAMNLSANDVEWFDN